MGMMPITDPSAPTIPHKAMTDLNSKIERVRTALEYTLATVSPGNAPQSLEKPDWVLVHRGRAFQSGEYLKQAVKDLIELRQEVEKLSQNPHTASSDPPH